MEKSELISLRGEKRMASEMTIEEFWDELQNFIKEGEVVSRKAIFEEFGRTKVWTYIAELGMNGFVGISIAGDVSIYGEKRNKRYAPFVNDAESV